MASILKVDKIRGTGLDSDTISLDGSGNITIPKNVTFSGTSTFSGTVSGDNAGKMEVITSSTTNGNVATLEIDISTSTDYAYQMLNLRGLAATSAQDMYMQMRKNSDDSYITDSYLSIIGSHFMSSSGASSSQNGLWNGSYFRMVHNGFGTDHTHQLNDMNIYFFNTANDKKFNVGADRFGQNGSGIMKEQMSGKGGYADVVNRLKLYMASGNLVYDEYTLYGFKRT